VPVEGSTVEFDCPDTDGCRPREPAVIAAIDAPRELEEEEPPMAKRKPSEIHKVFKDARESGDLGDRGAGRAGRLAPRSRQGAQGEEEGQIGDRRHLRPQERVTARSQTVHGDPQVGWPCGLAVAS
jgi:hypothetical protein